MSKRYPLQKWVLPLVMDPPRLCATVQVPNDIQHIAAFYGALYELTRWFNWQEDPAHLAVLAAEPWKEIFDQITLGDCVPVAGSDDMQFRQNGCKLEYSIDCVIWNTLYDPTDCIQAAIRQGTTTGQIPVGECREFSIVLQANQRALLPVQVSDAWTLEISDMQGAWSDGTAEWNCPDGTPYVLGSCVGSGGHAGDDPNPGALHMALLAAIDGAFYDVSAGLITIPAGVALQNLTFQANDSDLSNNSGSISFKVRVCANAAVAWDCTIDFAASDGGFVVAPSGGGEYTAGQGWTDTCVLDGAHYNRVVITKSGFGLVGAWTDIYVTYDVVLGGGFVQNSVLYLDVSTINIENPTTAGTDKVFHEHRDTPSDLETIALYISSTACGDSSCCGEGLIKVKSIRIKGIGTVPEWC